MKIIDSQYITMFMNQGQAVIPSQQAGGKVVMRPAREALKEVYANGWQPYETIPLGLGKSVESNTPQIQLVLHLVKYAEDSAPAVRRGRPVTVKELEEAVA